MLNTVVVMGRLTRDPEMRQTPNGVNVATFSIAVDRDFQSGEKKTDFIDCMAWRNTADFVSKYFSKGRMAVVNGRLQVDTWQDDNGNNRKAVRVVAESVYFGDSKRDSDGQAPAAKQSTQQEEFVDVIADDDDLPF